MRIICHSQSYTCNIIFWGTVFDQPYFGIYPVASNLSTKRSMVISFGRIWQLKYLRSARNVLFIFDVKHLIEYGCETGYVSASFDREPSTTLYSPSLTPWARSTFSLYSIPRLCVRLREQLLRGDPPMANIFLTMVYTYSMLEIFVVIS